MAVVFESQPPFCVVRKLLTMGVARKVFLWIREVLLEGSIPSTSLYGGDTYHERS